MRGVNKVILVGNLAADVELRHTPGGVAVADARIATNESYKDKEGVRQEKTEWHRLVAWGRQAEIFADFGKKGRPFYIEGSIQTRQYTDKDDVVKYITEVKVSDFTPLDPKRDD